MAEHPDFIADVLGKSPANAAAIVGARGQTVIFNVQTRSKVDPNVGYGECWCVPPADGHITDAWWGQHGALWLMVGDFDPHHDGMAQPFEGWGC